MSRVHSNVVRLYKGLRLNLKFIDLRYLMPIKAPATASKKAHSLKMSRVNNGSLVSPSLPVLLPQVTTVNRNKHKASARYGRFIVFICSVNLDVEFSFIDNGLSQIASGMTVCLYNMHESCHFDLREKFSTRHILSYIK